LKKDAVNLELLKQIRQEKRVRQTDISKALGKSKAYYTLIETGHIKVSLEAMKTIIRTLDLTQEQSKEIFGI